MLLLLFLLLLLLLLPLPLMSLLSSASTDIGFAVSERCLLPLIRGRHRCSKVVPSTTCLGCATAMKSAAAAAAPSRAAQTPPQFVKLIRMQCLALISGL
jgi:hypothetical protein